MLSRMQIREFIDEGFIALPQIVPTPVCKQVLDILWNDLPVKRYDPSTWTHPVIRLGEYGQEPFRRAANIPALTEAYDILAGRGNWIPRASLGSFPVRFPAPGDPADTGWHVDASFPGADPANYFEWRINVRSKGRALLMLFLFSDVDVDDAPTRLLPGSHKHVAHLLAPHEDEGLGFGELAGMLHNIPEPHVEFATGKMGTVYLCHPFIAHAAQPHKGKNPRFLAQPPLLLKNAYQLENCRGDVPPVAQAIIEALHDR